MEHRLSSRSSAPTLVFVSSFITRYCSDINSLHLRTSIRHNYWPCQSVNTPVLPPGVSPQITPYGILGNGCLLRWKYHHFCARDNISMPPD